MLESALQLLEEAAQPGRVAEGQRPDRERCLAATVQGW